MQLQLLRILHSKKQKTAGQNKRALRHRTYTGELTRRISVLFLVYLLELGSIILSIQNLINPEK